MASVLFLLIAVLPYQACIAFTLDKQQVLKYGIEDLPEGAALNEGDNVTLRCVYTSAAVSDIPERMDWTLEDEYGGQQIIMVVTSSDHSNPLAAGSCLDKCQANYDRNQNQFTYSLELPSIWERFQGKWTCSSPLDSTIQSRDINVIAKPNVHLIVAYILTVPLVILLVVYYSLFGGKQKTENSRDRGTQEVMTSSQSDYQNSRNEATRRTHMIANSDQGGTYL